MKLNNLKVEQETTVELKDPRNDTPLGAFVTLAGPEHPKRKSIVFANQRRTRARIQKLGRLELNDPEEDEAQSIDLCVACTLGWKGFEDDSGPVEFSEAASRKLYSDPELIWVRQQVLNALSDQAVFIKGSVNA